MVENILFRSLFVILVSIVILVSYLVGITNSAFETWGLGFDPSLLSSSDSTNSTIFEPEKHTRRNESSNDPELNRKVLLCGYDLLPIGAQLYPKAQIISVRSHSLANDRYVFNASKRDLLLDTFNGPCYYRNRIFEEFPGNLLYWNGEPKYLADKWRLSRCNRFYLGPTRRQVLPYRQKTYYAQYVMMYPEFRKPVMTRKAIAKPPKKFMVYRSSNCVRHREMAFDAILHMVETELRKTDIGEATGRCSGTRMDAHARQNKPGWTSIDDMQGQYRFSLSMDRVKETGYVSEKIVLGFAIGAIPIYYGTKEVFKLFNKDAFIYYDVASPQRALDTILHLEQNTTAYLEMRGKPTFAPNAEKLYFSYFNDERGHGYLTKQLRKDLENSCKK